MKFLEALLEQVPEKFQEECKKRFDKAEAEIAAEKDKENEADPDFLNKFKSQSGVSSDQVSLLQPKEGEESNGLIRFNPDFDGEYKYESTIKQATLAQMKKTLDLQKFIHRPVKKRDGLDKLVEQLFSLVIEVLSAFDFITDGYLIYKFAMSRHTAWLCCNIQTVIWPFMISYVPFISFKIQKYRATFEDGEQTCLCWSKTISFFATTPLLLVYLMFIDTFFLVISTIATPIFIVLFIISLGNIPVGRMEEWVDKLYFYFFDM